MHRQGRQTELVHDIDTCDVFSKNVHACQLFILSAVGNKRKASSLDIAPRTILDSGALQPRKWQLTGNDCSIVAQASGCPWPVLTDYWTYSCSHAAGILRPSQPR